MLLLDEGRVCHLGPVDAFLAAATTSVIEVRAGDAAGPWLEARGFVRRGAGWWTRTLAASAKRRLVEELTSGEGPPLEDMNVRDLESLELSSGGPRS